MSDLDGGDDVVAICIERAEDKKQLEVGGNRGLVRKGLRLDLGLEVSRRNSRRLRREQVGAARVMRSDQPDDAPISTVSQEKRNSNKGGKRQCGAVEKRATGR